MGTGPYDLVTQNGDVVLLPSYIPFRCRLGQTVPFFCSVYELGELTSPTTVACTLTGQDGSTISGTVVSNGTGNFQSNISIPPGATPGTWAVEWQTSGLASESAVSSTSFYVDAPIVPAVPAPPVNPWCPPRKPESDEISFPVGTATASSTAFIPAGDNVTDCQLVITTPYPPGTTITVGNAASPSLLMAAADSDPTTANTYDAPQTTAWGQIPAHVLVTVSGNPASGACTVSVMHGPPQQ
jgi:hypothetical protein